MPNWCSNRYAIQGKMGSLIRFKSWLEGLYPTPKYHLAIEQSKKLFILGATGYFQLLRPTDNLIPFDLLRGGGYGEPTFENEAYHHWVELIAERTFELNDENSRLISNLFYASGAHFVNWQDLDGEQQFMAEFLINKQAYDWYGCLIGWKNKHQAEDIFDRPFDVPEMGLPGDFYAVLPPYLTDLLGGFNSNLNKNDSFGLFSQGPSSYRMNVYRYGTKWPSFADARLEIHNETQASFDADTAWSPPSDKMNVAMTAVFGLEQLVLRYKEEGVGFAGWFGAQFNDNVIAIQGGSDDVTAGEWDEEKDDFPEVLGPSYILDMHKDTVEAKLSGLSLLIAKADLTEKTEVKDE